MPVNRGLSDEVIRMYQQRCETDWMRTSPELPRTPGYHDLKLALTLAGEVVELPVTLHLPATSEHAPLVTVLHYGGPPTGYYGRGLLEQLVVPAWQALNAVFIAPVSRGGEWQTTANMTAVRRLLTVVEAHYATAPHARYLVGYSLGAIGCWHWLMEADAPFAAVVPIAGQIPDALTSFTIPTYALHSRADRLFPSGPIETKLDALRAAHCPLACRILDDIDHFNVGAYRPALQAVLPWLPGADPG